MKRLMVLVLAVALCGSVVADSIKPSAVKNSDGSVTITLSREEVKQCGESGGCQIVTGDQLESFAQMVAEAAVTRFCRQGV